MTDYFIHQGTTYTYFEIHLIDIVYAIKYILGIEIIPGSDILRILDIVLTIFSVYFDY